MPIPSKIVPGPWGSNYKVNAQTLAVNLATAALGQENLPFQAMANLIALVPEPGPPSINEFWALQFQALTPAQRVEVIDLAGRLEDPYEMFDGQT